MGACFHAHYGLSWVSQWSPFGVAEVEILQAGLTFSDTTNNIKSLRVINQLITQENGLLHNQQDFIFLEANINNNFSI